jgi:integrase
MPKLHHKERLNENLSLGVQIVKGSSGRGYWTARIKFPQQDPVYKSTKVLYEENSVLSIRKATDVAFKLIKPYQQRWDGGHSIAEKWSVIRVGDDYLAEADTKQKKNGLLIKEGKEPIWDVEEGQGVWSKRRYIHDLGNWNNGVVPYIRHLQEQEGRTITIDELNDKKLKGFVDYCRDSFPNHSPATFDKWVTVLRRICSYAVDKELMDRVPNIKRARKGGRDGAKIRRRREISKEEYEYLISEQIKKFSDGFQHINENFRDYNYLAYLFIEIIAHCGIRPPAGQTPHTMLRWEDVKIVDDEHNKYAILVRGSEKGHSYKAVILDRGAKAWKELRRFYEERGFDCSEGYVFRHTFTRHAKGKRNFKKGDPIKSFSRSFNKVCKDCGLRGDTGKQKDNVSYSSLRAFYITQRLENDPDVRVEELSEITGVSVYHIMLHYYRFKPEKSYQHLTKGEEKVEDKKPLYYQEEGKYDYFMGYK